MKCLIVVDMQRDFIEPGAPVQVPGAYELGSRIRTFVDDANQHGWLTVATQDWHPPDHIRFYTPSRQNTDSVPSHQNNQQHTGSSFSKPAAAPTTESTSLSSSPQQFPPHCIAESEGARLVSPLENAEFNFYIRKGQQRDIESFSAFADAQGHSTGLGEWLHQHSVDSIAIAGVAIEYCVLATALDALLKWNFAPKRVAVVADGVGGVNPGAALHALQEIRMHGGVVMMWDEIVHDWIRRET